VKWEIPCRSSGKAYVPGIKETAGVINKSRTTGNIYNQLREKVGVMFGNPETTPGDGL